MQYEIIEYLKVPLAKNELEGIFQVLELRPKDVVRKSEKEFLENNLNEILENDSQMIDAIIKYPKILERPIIINGGDGVIGRPPEKILDII